MVFLVSILYQGSFHSFFAFIRWLLNTICFLIEVIMTMAVIHYYLEMQIVNRWEVFSEERHTQNRVIVMGRVSNPAEKEMVYGNEASRGWVERIPCTGI